METLMQPTITPPVADFVAVKQKQQVAWSQATML